MIDTAIRAISNQFSFLGGLGGAAGLSTAGGAGGVSAGAGAASGALSSGFVSSAFISSVGASSIRNLLFTLLRKMSFRSSWLSVYCPILKKS